MIQRIQTIYLLLAALAFGLLFVFPISDNLRVLDNGVLSGLAGAASGLSFIAIFLFKNRPLQKNFCWGSMIMGLGLAGYAGYIIFSMGAFAGNLKVGLALPLIAINLIFMAIRGIRNDENLLKSMDRLR